MTNKIFIATIISFIIISGNYVLAEESLSQRLVGRILLQVEDNGEAWYLNPTDQKRYFLNRPNDAFEIMRKLSIGITDENLDKFPIGFIDSDNDIDSDGLPDSLEETIGTDQNNPDSDGDGYNDNIEIKNNHNPLGEGKLNIDLEFANKNIGKIFLQTEKNGEAWYINPVDNKRYYLGRPADAFSIMRNLSLGISNKDINKINIGTITTIAPIPIVPPDDDTPLDNPSPQDNPGDEASVVFEAAAAAIRSGDIEKAKSYFTTETINIIDYTLNYLDADGRFTLSNIMSGASIDSSNSSEVVFKIEVYFSMGGYKVPVYFYVRKQADGTWKLTNL